MSPIVGFLSVLMGIGGGSFGVPLMSLHAVPIHRAVATAAGFGAAIAVPSVIGFLMLDIAPEGRPPYTLGAVNGPAFLIVIAMTLLTAPLGVRLAPALAAGCTTILKPAPETPFTAFAIVDLLERAGIPAGVINVVPSDRPTAMVADMLAHPAVRKRSFTGSTETGRALLGAAAEHVINPSMELGGNAPFIVFNDADIDAAVRTIAGSARSMGLNVEGL
jgi:hypothetical protein